MSKARKNLVANYFGQGWVAVMGLSFIPQYIKFLGIEAYGLIGLFGVIQAWLALLDMGMTPTVNREMARFIAGRHSAQSIRNLLRSLEVLSFCIAGVLSLGMLAASGFIAKEWVNSRDLSVTLIAEAVSLMAIVIALRFVEGIYRGSLIGLQHQVWYNAANAMLATLRHAGAVAVLAWLSPTLQAFFWWQAFVSLLSVGLFAVVTYRYLPEGPAPARFSREAILTVWRFAGGMMGITFLTLLLTQVDKLILSRLLTLGSFGYYVLAATVAGALLMLVSPITQSLFPRMVELVSVNDGTALAKLYHRGSQLVTVAIAPIAMLLVFFSENVIYLWTGDAVTADNTATILSALSLGTFLNAIVWMPYQCQLAHGWTGLTLKVNFIAVTVLIPAIFLVVPRFGGFGAAVIWVVLNAAYVLVEIQMMHRRLLPGEKWKWYWQDILRPAGGAVAVTLIALAFAPNDVQGRWTWFLFLSGVWVASCCVSLALANHVRSDLRGISQFLYGLVQWKQRA